MSLEKDITEVRELIEADIFKPADKEEVAQREEVYHRTFVEREIKIVRNERQCRVCQHTMTKGDRFLAVTAVNSMFGVCEPCIRVAAEILKGQ